MVILKRYIPIITIGNTYHGETKKLNLTAEQRTELEKGLKFGSCHRYRMRCQGVLLKADGIAAIVGGRSPYTIG
ncbi:MAG: hypothetical protein HDR88_01710 [Bacteroides sp.]|nr:hypothetical protein [Bacteroides sp.]